MSLQPVVDMVTTLCPGAGRAMIEKVVLDTTKDFMTAVPLWKHMDTIDGIIGQHEYMFTLPHLFAKMVAVKVGGEVAIPTDTRSLILQGQQQLHGERGAKPLYYVELALDEPTLVVSPELTVTTPDWIMFEAAMYPAEIADMPTQLGITYEQTLVEGAACLLFKQQNRPYTNLQLAALHGATYRGLRSKAYRNMMTGNAHASPGWRYPFWA